jgi:MFS family permease
MTADDAALKEERSGFRLWAPLLAVSLAMFITVLDSTMMNVAVPTIVKDLKTSVSGVQGAISLYSLVMASLMLVGGALGAIHGVKRMFLLGLIVYGVGTVLAAVAWNVTILTLGWSILEGIGAALIIPGSFTLIMANYSGSRRALGFGVLAGVQASAAAVGPILGGVLTTYLSWRVGFAGEAVIAIFILPLLPMVRELVTAEEGMTLDVGGAVFSALGLLSLVIGFIMAGRYGWWVARRPFMIGDSSFNPLGLSPTPLLLALGTILIVIFLHWQRRRECRGETPLVPLGVLSNPGLLAGSGTYILRSLVVTGWLFVLPLFMQSALDFSAFQSGLAILPFSAMTFIVSMVTAGWSERISPRRLIQAGFVFMGLGLAFLYRATSLQMTIGDMIIPTAVFGVGLGLIMAQLVNLTLSTVDPEDTPTASGTINALGEFGNSLGTAVIGSLLLVFLISGAVDNTVREANLTMPPKVRKVIIVELEDFHEVATPAEKERFFKEIPRELRQAMEAIIDRSTVEAMQDTILVIGICVLAALLASTFLPSRPSHRVRPEDRVACPEAEPDQS